jgi:NADH dehydrogenase
VIVGGGAGGLQPATHLGNRLGRRGRAAITVIDRQRTHLWKPLFHRVAAGSMDLNDHAVDYLAQARWHHFRFQQGEMNGLDRERRVVRLARVVGADGVELLPSRTVPYDTLVVAVGSQSNDFGTPGAARHAIALDSARRGRRSGSTGAC